MKLGKLKNQVLVVLRFYNFSVRLKNFKNSWGKCSQSRTENSYNKTESIELYSEPPVQRGAPRRESPMARESSLRI